MFTLGYAMLQPLPVGNFVWEDLDQWLKRDGTPDLEKIQSLKVDAPRGYLFEVDLGKKVFTIFFLEMYLFTALPLFRISRKAPQPSQCISILPKS